MKPERIQERLGQLLQSRYFVSVFRRNPGVATGLGNPDSLYESTDDGWDNSFAGEQHEPHLLPPYWHFDLCGSMGCGGGGGGSAGGSAAGPYIYAEVISFPTGGVPPGFVQSGFNSRVVVQVLNHDGGSLISYASVSLNGTVLPYVAPSEEYEGEINVVPGEDVVLTVTVGGATYVDFNRQFTSYPTITAPLVWESWSTQDTSIASWAEGSPVANAIYMIGLLDLGGQLVWPSGGTVQDLPTATMQYAFAPNSLTAGDRHFIVGLATASEIYGAAAGSGLVIGGFNSSPVTVTTGPAVSLVSVELTPNDPMLVTASARQLTVTGTYSNNSTRDLTDSVIWTSSDNTKATVDVSGLVTGHGNRFRNGHGNTREYHPVHSDVRIPTVTASTACPIGNIPDRLRTLW